MRDIFQIEYGPFSTNYHKDLIDDRFKKDVEKFIIEYLFPQLDEAPSSVHGRILAEYDNEKNCGPNSAVKNFFKMELKIISKSGSSDCKTILKYKNSKFKIKPGYTINLWTPNRKVEREIQIKRINETIKKVQNKPEIPRQCPICNSEIVFINNEHITEIRCKNNCFVLNYHKDPVSGEFLHGHTFMKEQFNESVR